MTSRLRSIKTLARWMLFFAKTLDTAASCSLIMELATSFNPFINTTNIKSPIDWLRYANEDTLRLDTDAGTPGSATRVFIASRLHRSWNTSGSFTRTHSGNSGLCRLWLFIREIRLSRVSTSEKRSTNLLERVA